MGYGGKEIKLTEQTIEQTEEIKSAAAPSPPAADPDAAVANPGASLQRPRDGRGRRQRRNGVAEEPGASLAGDATTADQTPDEQPRQRNGQRSERQLRRQEQRSRPRAPRAERGAAGAATDEMDEPDGADGASVRVLTETEALVLDLAGSAKRGSRAVTRARKKQRTAAAAVSAAADNPALGALNRHLNMLMQQMATAHRVIGRIAAERDALRQQLADLQGIPVEEIKVTTVGGPISDDAQGKSGGRRNSSSASSSSSGVAKFNYFTTDDITVTRKRRLILVGAILAVVAVLWYSSNLGWWSMPDNLSRDSLAHLPYVGELMTYFLAGWLFYRVFRVSSRGVRWVFPSDDQAKRRRR